jgi:hypothetical protein
MHGGDDDGAGAAGCDSGSSGPGAGGRGMCSALAPAAAGRAAGLSSEELMRMERDCSAHKYVLFALPLTPSRSISLLARIPRAC